MRIARNLRLSVRALTTQRVRTVLAVAGTAIGIAGVLVLTAIGEGARADVMRRLNVLGPDLLVVMATTVPPRAGRARQGDLRVQDLQVADAAAIRQAARGVLGAAPARDRTMPARYGRAASTTTILGTTPDWLMIRRFTLETGRFFTTQENTGRARVAVLGAEVRRNLFADSVDPVGHTVRIGRVPFEVVGVLNEVGVSVSGAASEDDRIVVPLETAMRRLFNTDYITMIFVQAAAGIPLDTVSSAVAAALRPRHARAPDAPDGFAVRSQRVLIETEIATQTSFQRLIMGLGFLALLVAGAGILSIMLLSVRERRPEIGLRVALGARRQDILLQFLAEAMLLALAGCAAGILFGLAIASIVSTTTSWAARVSPLALAASITSALAIGVVFGTLPALRAARLDPVAALRSGA